MSATYDPARLNEVPLFQVRFRLGDTDVTNATFQDEEIAFALGLHANNVTSACIDCVKALLPRLANVKEFTVGPYQEKQGAKSYDFWSSLLAQLQKEVAIGSPPIALPTGPSIFYYDMHSATNIHDPDKW